MTMKNLKFYLESLLDDEEELDDSTDEFLVKNELAKLYKTTGKISFRIKNHKYIVDVTGDVSVKRKFINTVTSLTNDIYTFGKIGGKFICDDCVNLKSLEGAPERCKEFYCRNCYTLKTLKGSPKKCSCFYCNNCLSLESLEGAPKECGYFYCKNCKNLESLEYAPQKCNSLCCEKCIKLKSLRECLGKSIKTIICYNCPNIRDYAGLDDILLKERS